MGTADIPLFTTEDLWEHYVRAEGGLSRYFREGQEEFLITRLEDTARLVSLPTRPHRRDVNEIVFVTGGTVVRGADLNTIHLTAGQIHLALAGQILTVESLSEDVTGFYCHFSLETIIRLYHKEHMVNELAYLGKFMKNAPIQLQGKAVISINAIFERLADEYRNENELSLIDAYLVTLCHEIKKNIPDQADSAKQSKSFEITEQFKALMSHHLHHRKNIAFYAGELKLSPNHLNKAVRQATGKPASALLSEMLVLEAKVLLRHSGLSVSEIGYRLGFADQSYFSRFFRIQSGLTPTDYRQQVGLD